MTMSGRHACAPVILPVPGWVRLAVVVLSISPILHAEDVARVFRPADLIQWQPHSFSGETRYRLTEVDGRSAVHAQCRDEAASGLFLRQEIDLDRTPILEWQWRVTDTFDGIDEQQRDGDDYPARLYAVDEHTFMPWRTRAINYVWASEMAPGAQWENAYQSRAIMVAMRSGADSGTGWVTERRDLRADFREIHGAEPGKLDALAIMTDCDDSGQRIEAWYGEVRLLPAPGPSEPAGG